MKIVLYYDDTVMLWVGAAITVVSTKKARTACKITFVTGCDPSSNGREFASPASAKRVPSGGSSSDGNLPSSTANISRLICLRRLRRLCHATVPITIQARVTTRTSVVNIRKTEASKADLTEYYNKCNLPCGPQMTCRCSNRRAGVQIQQDGE